MKEKLREADALDFMLGRHNIGAHRSHTMNGGCI